MAAHKYDMMEFVMPDEIIFCLSIFNCYAHVQVGNPALKAHQLTGMKIGISLKVKVLF